MARHALGIGPCSLRNLYPLTMNPALILAAINGVAEVVKLINSARDRARASGELSDEQDAAFDAKMEEAFKQIHWKL